MLASFSVQAAVTTTHLWRLGEDDPNPLVGQSINSDTRDAVGTIHLGRVSLPTYTSQTFGNFPASTLGISFNGTSDGLFLGGPNAKLGNNFGVELFVNPATVSGGHVLFYNGNTGTTGWGIYQQGATYAGLFGGVAFFGSAPAVAGQWDHLALVRDNGIATLYINGAAVGSTGSSPNASGVDEFMAGYNGILNQEHFSGSLDHIRTFTFTAGQFNPATDLSFVSVVPEPGTLTLLGLGAAGLLAARRRRA